MQGYPRVLLDASCRAGELVTSVETVSGTCGDGRLVAEALGMDRLPPAGGAADGNVIEWTGNEVAVRTSRQNVTPVYHWLDARHERLLLGTDLVSLTAMVISATDPSGALLT